MRNPGTRPGTDSGGDSRSAGPAADGLTPARSHAVALVALFLLVLNTPAQTATHPLQPPDRSSPQATLRTFLDSSDAVANFFVKEYRPSPTREAFHRLLS